MYDCKCFGVLILFFKGCYGLVGRDLVVFFRFHPDSCVRSTFKEAKPNVLNPKPLCLHTRPFPHPKARKTPTQRSESLEPLAAQTLNPKAPKP